MSDSIITLDVGGQIFKTQTSTLTKYPDSRLAIMFQHTKDDSTKDEKEKNSEIVTRNFGDRLASFFRINKNFNRQDEKLDDEKESDESKEVPEVVVDGTEDKREVWSFCLQKQPFRQSCCDHGLMFKPRSDVVSNLSTTEDQTVMKTVEEILEQTVNGLAPMTKEGAYFLDANPLYFGEILDYLRYGKIVAEDPNVLKGIKNLANYFRLEELIKELVESEPRTKDEKLDGGKKIDESEEVPEVEVVGTGEKKDLSWVTLDLQGTKEIKVRLEHLTRFEYSVLARYFLGNDQAEMSMSKKGWIKKESEDRFYVGRPWSTTEHMFNFLQAPRSYVPNVPVEYTEQCSDFLKEELNMFGLGNYYTATQSFNQNRLCQFNWI